MAAGRTRERRTLIAVAAAALVALIALLRWDFGADDAPVPAGRDADAGLVSPGDAPPQHAAPAACQPRARRACQQGDVWWLDGCDRPETRAEDCEGRGCDIDSCVAAEPDGPGCGEVSTLGTCEGDIASACIAKRLVSIDCGLRGERCVMTREGVACLPRDPEHGCTERDRPTCDGERLRVCVDGVWTELDCAARKAKCTQHDEFAHCERRAGGPVDPASATMPPDPAATSGELCDGRDNDADNRIDESEACAPVALVAFVPDGAVQPNLEARMHDELAVVNRAFAPLKFAWARSVAVPAKYREFDPKQMEQAALQLSQVESAAFAARLRTEAPAATSVEPGLSFYIPVLFAQKLMIAPPKAGISTLPNARCGGVRISDSPSPPHGLIVLSEQRSRETLTHELGHYLGLCHTHEELSRYATSTPDREPCLRSGDGICDTPPDPGPNTCLIVDDCQLNCGRQDRPPELKPDARNIMSYYLPCRRALSAEQLAEAERNLNLRRGWFRCLDPRDCSCEPGAAASCPAEMSCHPGENANQLWSCELDGPGLPGTACRNTAQCGSGAICIAKSEAEARCARPCASDASCHCEDVGLGFRVCAEDLDPRAR